MYWYFITLSLISSLIGGVFFHLIPLFFSNLASLPVPAVSLTPEQLQPVWQHYFPCPQKLGAYDARQLSDELQH